jgi:hypothetical protein
MVVVLEHRKIKTIFLAHKTVLYQKDSPMGTLESAIIAQALITVLPMTIWLKMIVILEIKVALRRKTLLISVSFLSKVYLKDSQD